MQLIGEAAHFCRAGARAANPHPNANPNPNPNPNPSPNPSQSEGCSLRSSRRSSQGSTRGRSRATSSRLPPPSTSRYSSSIECAWHLPQGTLVARAAWHLPQGSSIERAWHLPEGSGIERHAHGMCMHAHGICMACAWHVLPDRDRHEIAMRSTPLYPAGGRARRRCTGRPDQRQHRLQGHRQVDHTAGGATLPLALALALVDHTAGGAGLPLTLTLSPTLTPTPTLTLTDPNPNPAQAAELGSPCATISAALEARHLSTYPLFLPLTPTPTLTLTLTLTLTPTLALTPTLTPTKGAPPQRAQAAPPRGRRALRCTRGLLAGAAVVVYL